jgi:hypothetical protein
MLAACTTSAQMVGTSVFLQGNYVEAGICPNGDFGATGSPAGYHPHYSSTTSTGPLGFVADPAMDGWTVGTPAYMGDYFTPGSPFEGWNIQVGTARGWSHSCAGFNGGLTGTNTAYNISGTKVIGTWEGTFDSMTIRQVTTLDSSALYFTMRITIINNASVPKNNIYYLRSLDPDNDVSWPGGGFATTNVIQYQRPNPLNATVVRATGLSTTAPVLSLGTADTNARCFIYSAWPISGTTDLASVYGGTMSGATYSMGSSVTGDEAIGLLFKIDHLAPVDSASDSVGYKPTIGGRRPANQYTIGMFYSFSNPATDSALAELASDGIVTPPPPPTSVATVTGRTISAYPNPAHTHINISGLDRNDIVYIYDMMGRDAANGWQRNGADIESVPLNNLPDGNYIIVVRDQYGNARSQIPFRKQ